MTNTQGLLVGCISLSKELVHSTVSCSKKVQNHCHSKNESKCKTIPTLAN
ncbi:3'(2'),5'-bisphosphate nucleotidase 2 [Candida albicans Ca529L]|nr:3'(2'),5'-bisphosphate nucleotidase 2 [Candida albicans Ca529L]